MPHKQGQKFVPRTFMEVVAQEGPGRALAWATNRGKLRSWEWGDVTPPTLPKRKTRIAIAAE
ncbi:MAG: hypothetical protein RLZZ342_117 [Candidatus Parcubacteria bacterium]|jgi:hypothetical protein